MKPNEQLIINLLVAATLLPLFSSIFVIFFARFIGKLSAWITIGVMAVSFIMSVFSMINWFSLGDEARAIIWQLPWIPIGDGHLYLGAMVDGLTVAMMVMVTGVSLLVHLYSVGYMSPHGHYDPRYERFFSYLSLFTFSMLGIVISNSIMQLFVFWELVGLTSYLLIGFWFEKKGPRLACKKAFVMNRVGDMGFLIGFGILFVKLAGNVTLPGAEGAIDTHGHSVTGMLGAINAILASEGHTITNPPMWLTCAGIGLFFGAIGKSAQFPLQTWLPDAMEGPTPVSSIVHSATMVAAGVYLTARIYPILTPGAHLFIATIGLITLVMAACMALVMTDIKKVLAYSTLSQLGYMILGLGAGAYTFAVFHLITHAFFKCCLFQCSGSVILAADHQQDMRYYGGLWKKMPITGTCYLICTFAIAGASIPYTDLGISGFYSKDGIIAGSVNYGEAMIAIGAWSKLFYYGPIGVAYLTVFYMARSFALTFLGKPRDEKIYAHAHEVPWTMFVPQIGLATMAILAAPGIMPFWQGLIASSEPEISWMQPAAALAHGHAMHSTHVSLLHGFGWIISLAVGIAIYNKGFAISSKIAALPGVNLIYTWWKNKFYFDMLYDAFAVWLCKAFAEIAAAIDRNIVDRLVNLAGSTTKGWAFLTGIIDNKVVDGAVNGAAEFAQTGGRALSSTQAGRVRLYVLMLFASISVLMLVVVAAVILNNAG